MKDRNLEYYLFMSADKKINLDLSDFKFIQSLIYQKFGICLSDNQSWLVENRLKSTLGKLNIDNYKEYIGYLANDQSGKGLIDLVNQLTTNHTSFFRENAHFNLLTNTVLPNIVKKLKAKGEYDLRVWSAGCSSGEEAYTLAILINEFLFNNYPNCSGGILATDISDKVLTEAKRGIYSQDKIKSIPEAWKLKYFTQVENDKWQVKEKLKLEVTYRNFNLMNEKFPFKKPFHIIFCRNVIIYFDQENRNQLMQKFNQWTVDDGYLFLGHSESLQKGITNYQQVYPSVYKKDDAGTN